MKVDAYLVIKKAGVKAKGTLRVTKTPPSLDRGEIAVKLHLDVPDALFTTPQLQAKITIPESSVNKPTVSAEITDNIRKAVKLHTGVDQKIEIVNS
jgi:hypothetical protein